MRKFKPSSHMPRVTSLGTLAKLVRRCEVDQETECWLWQGCTNAKGYGQIWYQGRAHWVHRVSYAIFNGEIPEEMHVHHTCSNPSCCNPEHLELLTPSDNSLERHERHRDVRDNRE